MKRLTFFDFYTSTSPRKLYNNTLEDILNSNLEKEEKQEELDYLNKQYSEATGMVIQKLKIDCENV